MDSVLKEQLLVLSSTWRHVHLKFLNSFRNNKTATILVSQTNPVASWIHFLCESRLGFGYYFVSLNARTFTSAAVAMDWNADKHPVLQSL